MVGDMAMVLLVADLPFVLRRRRGERELVPVGDCYVDDIIDGEALDEEGFEVEAITVV